MEVKSICNENWLFIFPFVVINTFRGFSLPSTWKIRFRLTKKQCKWFFFYRILIKWCNITSDNKKAILLNQTFLTHINFPYEYSLTMHNLTFFSIEKIKSFFFLCWNETNQQNSHQWNKTTTEITFFRLHLHLFLDITATALLYGNATVFVQCFCIIFLTFSHYNCTLIVNENFSYICLSIYCFQTLDFFFVQEIL